MTTAHFEVIRGETPAPVVVEIPHAGLMIDETAAQFTKLPELAVAHRAVEADADVGADAVWVGSEIRGVTRIVARTSRYVIDLNTEPRRPGPDEEKRPLPLRAIRRRSAAGVSWHEEPLPKAELERRIREVFEPYHAAIERELAAARREHRRVVLLSSHTFPGKTSFADVVVGTLHGQSAPEALRASVAESVVLHGLSVSLEDPFAGGYALRRHHDNQTSFAVQLEIARRLVTTKRDGMLEVDAGGVARVARMLDDIVSVLRTFCAEAGD